MNLQEIKQAIEDGKIVCWSHTGYEVKKVKYASGGIDYMIVCLSNEHAIGLTWRDEVTMNGKESDFFIKQ